MIATGRGKGFQGVMKRHHFAGGAATHGSMFIVRRARLARRRFLRGSSRGCAPRAGWAAGA